MSWKLAGVELTGVIHMSLKSPGVGHMSLELAGVTHMSWKSPGVGCMS
jgi:hypothetical protein